MTSQAERLLRSRLSFVPLSLAHSAQERDKTKLHLLVFDTVHNYFYELQLKRCN